MGSKPYWGVVIAYMVTGGILQVMQHFRLLALPKKEQLAKDMLSRPLSGIRQLICLHIRVNELHIDNSRILLRAAQWIVSSSPMLPGLYDPYGYVWVECNCENENAKCEALYTFHRRTSKSNYVMDGIVLAIFKNHKPSDDNADPGWADKFVQELIEEQNALVREFVRTVYYKAEEGGEWECEEKNLANSSAHIDILVRGVKF